MNNSNLVLINKFDRLKSMPRIARHTLRFYKFLKINNSLKNKYYNEPIFILGGGPSINTVNIEMLEHKNIMAINSFYHHSLSRKIFHGNGLKFYISAPAHPPHSRELWNNYLTSINDCIADSTNLILGINNYEDSFHNLLQGHRLKSFPYFYCPSGPRYIEFSTFNILSNLNPAFPLISAGAASVYALIYACFMGFNPIYTVGIDHTQIFDRLENLNDHFYSTENTHNNINIEAPPLNYVQMMRQANTLYQYHYISKHYPSTKIYNLSKRSLVDVFEYANFSSILSQVLQ